MSVSVIHALDTGSGAISRQRAISPVWVRSTVWNLTRGGRTVVVLMQLPGLHRAEWLVRDLYQGHLQTMVT